MNDLYTATLQLNKLIDSLVENNIVFLQGDVSNTVSVTLVGSPLLLGISPRKTKTAGETTVINKRCF